MSPGLPVVELVVLGPAALRALADGDLVAAEAAAPVPLSPYLAGPECRWVWGVRAEQVVADPASARWITRVVRDRERGLTVGRAGFHGPPDAAGMVEVGYSTDPLHRRQGYARAALRALLAWAAEEPAVTTVRASVAPSNTASRDLVLAEGFVAVGEQVDEEDGLEIVYEVAVGVRLR
ncbi:Protein N-acetyltransferase, RimJ/RimL family [Blastococcus sp. DSM 46786]|uniref:GNAT family N-acetyltransferase n=1 Tax=Blastococcus sp. DSM 46786 TaxID=1798227 RepID=UPI0008CAE365|nr:GNAT family N-acetyltransferase [Blastococcus sp. DSM 46786]SEK29588.1 Protein N-acetyltransferase, RimJ/RimL family [Blastococcus sp. DSM 46786]